MNRQRAARGLKVLILSVGVAVACAPGERPPAAPVRGTLALPGERQAGRDAGPFRVVLATPQREAPQAAEMSLVFSRPLRALDAAGEVPPPRIEVSPPVAGRFQWVGSRALRFVPEKSKLPGSTRFSVTVAGETAALDGARLGEAYRYEFETPRVEIVSAWPGKGHTGAGLDGEITLELSQPVEPARLEAGVTLSAIQGGKAKSLPFGASRPDPRHPKKALLRTRSRLPKDTEIRLDVTASLVGEEGPLPARPWSSTFRTYGPLTAGDIDCPKDHRRPGCSPGSGIYVSLSNAVRLGDLRKLVTFEPAVRPRIGYGEDAEMVRSVDFGGPLAPGATYTVRFPAAITDEHGQRLGKDETRTFTMAHLAPRVEIGVAGEALVPSAELAVPVGSVNVARYDLTTTVLRPEDLPSIMTGTHASSIADLATRLPATKRRLVTPKGERNRIVKESVPLSSVLPGGKGVLAVGVSYSDDERVTSDARLLKVSDLAVSAKVSRHGSLVWVTRLLTGAPVPEATVEVMQVGAATRSYRTDRDGFATIPAADFAPDLARYDAAKAVVVARSGADWTFSEVDRYVDTWRLPVSVDLSGEQRAYGLLFTDRGVYRPGDLVRVKGIVRKEARSGNAVPAGVKVEVALHSPDDEKLATRAVTTSAFGTFAVDFTVPEAASLGGFSVRATGVDGLGAATSFDVAEYRPAEFKVEAESAAPSYVRGDEGRFMLRGDYLFGAPMAEADVRYVVSHSGGTYQVPGAEGFVTAPDAYYQDLDNRPYSAGQLATAETKLDAKGSLTVAAKLVIPTQTGPEIVRVDAEVTDVSRQAVSGSTQVVVHPAAFYVGLQEPEDRLVTAPVNAAPKVVTFAPSGQRTAGQEVTLDLFERRWTLARERTEDGQTRAVSRLVDAQVATCKVKTRGAEPATCPLAVKQGGYHVVRARARDTAGRTTESAYGLYALGEGQVAYGDNDRRQVELVPNRKQYEVGDTAKVLVKSPFAEAEALVTVERAGVYRSQRVTLRGPTPTVTVPITDDLRPNAFVGVHLLRTKGVGAAGDAPYRLGYAELTIDPEARRLHVDVTPQKRELRPGEEVTVDLAVRPAVGKSTPTELTVYAVDEGVLMLTGYKTPDPLRVFTAPRPLQVATLETRDALAKLSLADFESSLGAEKGAEGGGGGEGGARRDFRQTAYFNPSVLTDANGRARVTFRLPDSLTTYRLMAVATGSSDQYGLGTGSVVASKKLMARPSLPRLLRAGDRASAGIVVSRKGTGAGKVRVRLRAKGIAVDGPTEREVEVPADGSVEVAFPLRADTVGQASFRFDVESGGEKDAVEVVRKVVAPGALEAVALYGSTETQIAEKIGKLDVLRSDVGELNVVLASSALVGLDAGATTLVEYPYACTEQLSSRVLPLLPLRELARAYGFEPPPGTDGSVGRTLAAILSRQRYDGGFGMWPESTETSPWVSAYATWVLNLAAKQGATVPKNARDRANAYLRRYLSSRDGSNMAQATAAFVVDVLAEGGAPDPGYMGKLYEKRAELPLFARAFLLHALAVSKGPASNVSELSRDVAAALRIDGDAAFVAENVGDDYAAVFDSTPRTGALVLRALLAAEPKHPLGIPLARGLLRQRVDGSWRSTQETAYALLALDAYRRSFEATPPSFSATAWLGDAKLHTAAFGGGARAAKSSTPLAKLLSGEALRGGEGSALTFQKDGSGTLFYEARLRYVRRTLPTTPLDEGFFLQRASRPVEPAALASALRTVENRGAERFRAGGLVLTDLVVVAPSARDYVVIDDPLPAGVEAVDSGLATTASWLHVSGSVENETGDCDGCESERDRVASGRGFASAPFRQEVRDDRVLFFIDHLPAGIYHYRYLARATTKGTFVLPPAKVEEMYTPETFGRTAAGQVVIE